MTDRGILAARQPARIMKGFDLAAITIHGRITESIGIITTTKHGPEKSCKGIADTDEAGFPAG